MSESEHAPERAGAAGHGEHVSARAGASGRGERAPERAGRRGKASMRQSEPPHGVRNWWR
jgi:hypothetical protein